MELTHCDERNMELKKAVVVLKELSADERTRMIAEAQEKARRDEASRVKWAREEGHKEGHREIIDLLKSGKSPEEIIKEYSEKGTRS